MTQRKQNCWETTRCGREPEGALLSERGTCPAATDASFHGINSGVNGGRICWAVAGTFCNGKVQGTFAEKRHSCLECGFFKTVRQEEGVAKLDTKFLSFISRNGEKALFRNENYRFIRSGERFITQGEVGETAYVIQRGSCLVIVEKDGQLHPVNHYGEGDIVGGMGILTGEPHLAHVEAETDMELWALTRADFESISERDPELLNFLTELVANRFDSHRPTAYRTIGKYVATDIIGRGGFSIVYRGVHSTLNMPVAIKMMRHNLAMDRGFLGNFRGEAKTIAALNHENIVRIYDIEERYRTVFIVMELLEGESLKDLLRRIKRITVPLAMDILLQACRGLEYAHERGIIHRDVNPDNLFLLSGNRLKILDFGLACPSGTEDINLAGTAAYMSPEQIEGEAVSPRTDVYGLGAVAFEMLTGSKPFRGETTQEILNLHLTEDIPDPATLLPEISSELREFVQTAARRDPERRYPSVRHALEALRPLAERLDVTGRHVPARPRKMSNLLLFYPEEQQVALKSLMEEFSAKAQELGADLRIADFQAP